MPPDGGSSVPRRQLGRLLRRAREGAGVNLTYAAAGLEISVSRMSRMEIGEAPVKLMEVKTAAEMYGIDDDMREVMLSLAAASKEKGWWAAYGKSVPTWFDLYLGMEEAAAGLRHYENGLIPGLLQTEEYAAVVLGAEPGINADEVEKRVKLRRQRQRLLARARPAAPRLDVIVEEAVIARPLADTEAWQRQLAHLVNISQKPAISVRVIPRGRAIHPVAGRGSFVLLDFEASGPRKAEPTTVYIEGLSGSLYLDEPEEVDTYERAWKVLDGLALDRDASDDLIGTLIEEAGNE